MEVNTTTLLPYILDLLSRQPDLCCSIEELCNEVKDAVMDEVIAPYGSLLRAVEFAVELGMNLGLLSLTNKRIRIPFKFFSGNKLPESPRQQKKSSEKPMKKPRVAIRKTKNAGRIAPKKRTLKKKTSCKKHYKNTMAISSLNRPLTRQLKQRLLDTEKPENPSYRL